MAGLAAMFLAGALGSSMGLNDTATFMASCVAFVAVALWTDSRLARWRRNAARAEPASVETSRDNPSQTLDSDSPKREGRPG